MDVFWILRLGAACQTVFEDGSAMCWSFIWSVPW
jgi:hypothetical protein